MSSIWGYLVGLEKNDMTENMDLAASKPEMDFFLPDLCQAQSILFLVLVSELLIFVQILFSSSFFDFDWLALGLASLFIQWVVLVSALRSVSFTKTEKCFSVNVN